MEAVSLDFFRPTCYYRGLNNYQDYLGGVPYYIFGIMGPQNPILIVKTAILVINQRCFGTVRAIIEIGTLRISGPTP